MLASAATARCWPGSPEGRRFRQRSSFRGTASGRPPFLRRQQTQGLLHVDRGVYVVRRTDVPRPSVNDRFKIPNKVDKSILVVHFSIQCWYFHLPFLPGSRGSYAMWGIMEAEPRFWNESF